MRSMLGVSNSSDRTQGEYQLSCSIFVAIVASPPPPQRDRESITCAMAAVSVSPICTDTSAALKTTFVGDRRVHNENPLKFDEPVGSSLWLLTFAPNRTAQ